MINRYNYSYLIKTLLNNNKQNEIIQEDINNEINNEKINNKVYILDDKTIENIEKISKYINFLENIYQKIEQIIYNFYFRLTKKVPVQ